MGSIVLNIQQNKTKMASSAIVTNIAPQTVQLDKGAKQKQKAAENASKADEIQHGREIKMAESAQKKADKINTQLENEKEALKSKQEKLDELKRDEEIAGH